LGEEYLLRKSPSTISPRDGISWAYRQHVVLTFSAVGRSLKFIFENSLNAFGKDLSHIDAE
jgi:hypothetical protein